MKARHVAWTLLAVGVTTLLAGCSSAKNTSATRWWQAFNTRYNVYFNGAQAYIEGSLQKEQGNKDNYTEMLPLYTVGNKNSREIGKASYDRAIEKAEKAIDLHSIKRRPEWNKNRRKTARDIEWLGRKEYNPFLWKAWMLMGRSQFFKGDFDAAATTFSYMARLYQTQPAISGRARAWLAKCYLENGFVYDAEDVIRNQLRDSIDWRAVKDWDYTFADYYIRTGDYAKAVPFMHKVIRHEGRRRQKAREYFLLGQLEEALGHTQQAYKAYGHVIRMNPPYELAFNARIAQSEVMAKGNGKRAIARLKRMAASDNNVDYQDQVYYAIGNIYLAQRDTVHAISSYERGNERATRNGIEKGVLLLKLGNLYWDMERYGDAQRCYGEAIGLLDKDRPDYEELSNRSRVLDELVPFTDAVHLQDSLQALARMNDHDRNAAIDRTIEALKKKEKEEQRKQDEADAALTQQKNGAVGNRSNNRPTNQQTNKPTNKPTNQTWYFYSPLAVQQGKQQFQRLWGKRENIDNWQRVNKTVVASLGDEQQDALTNEQRDSIASAEAHEDSLRHLADSAQNDPHRREYYLAQIPFTPEQLDASNATLMDGLFNSGVIFKDKLDNLPLSKKALNRLVTRFPGYEHIDEAYYHLFLLYSRMGQTARAETFIDSLRTKCPESQWTTLLTDPYFAENAREGVQIEDSLYAATYEAFKADRLDEVKANSALSEKRFPLGANRDKFIFISGLGLLNDGDAGGCLKNMNTLVEKYPESRLSEMAGMIINGVKDGRRLHGAKFDLGDVWSRRAEVLADSDSIHARQLSDERNTAFVFMLVYQPDSVNENKLLFQMARYNFTSYLVRDFDIAIEEDGDLHRMQVGGFRSYDEALLYARQLLQQKAVVAQMGAARPVIISEENLPLLGTNFSYDDYRQFYVTHFAPLKVPDSMLLEEPAEIAEPEEPVLSLPPMPTEPTAPAESEKPTAPTTQVKTTVPVTPVEQGGTTVPVEDSATKPAAKPVTKTTAKPVTKPATKPAPKPVTKKPEKKTFDPLSEDYELDGF